MTPSKLYLLAEQHVIKGLEITIKPKIERDKSTSTRNLSETRSEIAIEEGSGHVIPRKHDDRPVRIDSTQNTNTIDVIASMWKEEAIMDVEEQAFGINAAAATSVITFIASDQSSSRKKDEDSKEGKVKEVKKKKRRRNDVIDDIFGSL